MNEALERLARELELDAAAQVPLRLAFGISAANRVAHLLTDDDVRAELAIGNAWLAGETDADGLAAAAGRAAALATAHPGSGGLDGTGNAAVSASHAVARALAGRALEAAGYSAYAAVYAYSSHAVTDPRAYADEHRWQVETLRSLAGGAAPDGRHA